MDSDFIRIMMHVAPFVSTLLFSAIYFLLGLLSLNRQKMMTIIILQGICMLQFFLHAFGYYYPMYLNFTLNFIGFACFIIGNKMRVIGLTGGISTGKSTVSNIFKSEGYIIIDCDLISKDMRKMDKGYQKQLIQAFGSEVWDPAKQEIKSDVLGNIVFADPTKREILNNLSHWRMFRDIFKKIFYHRVYLGNRRVILDAPLLFETKLLEFICMPIILVFLPTQDMQVERLMKRDKLTKEKAMERINAQFPIEKKMEKSQILVNNGEKLGDLERQIKQKTIPILRKGQWGQFVKKDKEKEKEKET